MVLRQFDRETCPLAKLACLGTENRLIPLALASAVHRSPLLVGFLNTLIEG
jgi:hypothetical protein